MENTWDNAGTASLHGSSASGIEHKQLRRGAGFCEVAGAVGPAVLAQGSGRLPPFSAMD